MSDLRTAEEAARAKKRKRIQSQSRCICGHTGDGENSDHKDTVSFGHGACRLCSCPKFIWAGFLGGIGENESWKSGANPMREGPKPT